MVDDVQSIILMKEEEENAESHLFNYDWLDTSTQKYYDENRFLVVSIFTASLLPRIQAALSSSFDALNQDHLLNFQQVLSAARQIWDADVLLEKMIKPVTARILSAVPFSFSFALSQIQSWTHAASQPVFFFTSLLRFQTLLPGFDSDVFPHFTNALSAYLKSLADLRELKSVLVELKPLFDSESPAARRSLFALENTALPKLVSRLRALQIDPSDQQHIDYFTSVLEWSDCIDLGTLSAVLEGEFFPKWLAVLFDWIHQPGVNLQEIVMWIQGWRSLFPDELLRESHVVQQFNRCWDIVNDFLDGTNKIDSTQFRKPVSYYRVLQNRKIEEANRKLRDVRVERACDD